MEKIMLPAPAKINLALDIKGVRGDGYHEVEMIMQSISLLDNILIKKINSGIRLNVTDTRLPNDENNIAYQAANLIKEKTGLTAGVDIYIDKHIPIAAGLAGGSTDAAAVLVGINTLFDLNLSEDSLLELAAELGSDVPFCMRGGTALAYGRGELLQQLPDIKEYNLVIVNPGIPISTVWAYQEFDKLEVEKDVSIKKLVNILKEEENISWNEGWVNILEEVAIPHYQEIADIKNMLKEMGSEFALMSGSGSTVFAVVENKAVAQNIVYNWPRTNDFITTAQTLKKDFLDL